MCCADMALLCTLCPAKDKLLLLPHTDLSKGFVNSWDFASTSVLAVHPVFVSLTTSTPMLNKHSDLFEHTFVLKISVSLLLLQSIKNR